MTNQKLLKNFFETCVNRLPNLIYTPRHNEIFKSATGECLNGWMDEYTGNMIGLYARAKLRFNNNTQKVVFIRET